MSPSTTVMAMIHCRLVYQTNLKPQRPQQAHTEYDIFSAEDVNIILYSNLIRQLNCFPTADDMADLNG